MKFFVVFACAFVAASASSLSPLVYGAQHLPIIGSNGVPVDTADVQIARAAHLIHKADALARNGDLVKGIVAPVLAPVVSTYAANLGLSVIPQVSGPVDTAEVAIAKANHFAAHAEALARNGHTAVLLRHRRGLIGALHPVVYSAPQHIPVIGPNGVPVEPVEVQHARAAHLIAKAEVQARDQTIVAPVIAHGIPAISLPVAVSGPQHIPVIGANGVPVDTAEVQLARAAHLNAKAEAHARNGDLANVANLIQAAPVVHAGQHIPVIANGVPVDTIEVQQAKLAHAVAHAKAAAHAYL